MDILSILIRILIICPLLTACHLIPILTSHHLHRDRNHGTVIGMVEAHPTKPGEVVLRNVGLDDWVMTPEGESAVTVPSRRRLGVRTMVIDFGSVMGRISVD